MKIAIVLGTRPEIIKMSPVIDKIQENNTQFTLIHTGQHYDTEMSEQFFKDLNLPQPDYNINVKADTPITQISIIIKKLEEILQDEQPDIVLVQGDTNAVLAGSLCADKLKIPLGHIEAGLRSFDKTMPEEINREIADICSELYFVPTKKTGTNLLNTGVDHKKIFVTGNTIVDACMRNLPIAQKKSKIKDEIKFDKYITLTLHRAENVDDKQRLDEIINSILSINYNIVFPIHPHTRKSLQKYDLYEKIEKAGNIQIIKPLGYLDFLALLGNTTLLLTDSGGVQEEAITLNIPCVTLRYNTERPETIDAGANILAGTKKEQITENITDILENRKIHRKMSQAENPYGDGNSAGKIYDIIKEYYDKNMLEISESEKIEDFEDYRSTIIKDKITVDEFEKQHTNILIQQVFEDHKAIYFDNNTNLEDKTVIYKKFKKYTQDRI